MTQLNESTIKNTSDLLVYCLEQEGVKKIFGVPGEENLDFLESVRTSSIQLVLTRHEQSAGFMAATYGRLTQTPGVCLATLGPGATNLVTASAYAYLGGMPLILITGQKPIKKSKQGRFQIIDVVSMMRPITKMTRQIVNGQGVCALVREAFRLATEERPGPVHLELPEDIAKEPITTFNRLHVHPNFYPKADPQAIQKALSLIAQAKYPLILIGAGANRKQTCQALTRFVEKTQFYFFSTQMGMGVVRGDHPQCLGVAALSEQDYIHCAIERSDCIINVGHDIIEKPPFFMKDQTKTVIHINYFPAQVDDVYFPQLEIEGHIASTIEALSDGFKAPVSPYDVSYFKRVKEGIDAHIQEHHDHPGFPLLPQRIVHDVRKVMASDSVLSLDNGMYKIWFSRNYPARLPNSVLLDNALATMGAGLCGAMGAALLNPKAQVLAVCGDGGFLMNSQELETAVRLHLNVVVLILNDQGYGMIQWKQAAMRLPHFGLSFNNPDFIQYAHSYGAKGHRVNAPDELQGILERAFEQKGVHVIDCPVDYSQNVKVLIDELEKKVCLI